MAPSVFKGVCACLRVCVCTNFYNYHVEQEQAAFSRDSLIPLDDRVISARSDPNERFARTTISISFSARRRCGREGFAVSRVWPARLPQAMSGGPLVVTRDRRATIEESQSRDAHNDTLREYVRATLLRAANSANGVASARAFGIFYALRSKRN